MPLDIYTVSSATNHAAYRPLSVTGSCAERCAVAGQRLCACSTIIDYNLGSVGLFYAEFCTIGPFKNACYVHATKFQI